jgi:hypothetical protein
MTAALLSSGNLGGSVAPGYARATLSGVLRKIPDENPIVPDDDRAPLVRLTVGIWPDARPCGWKCPTRKGVWIRVRPLKYRAQRIDVERTIHGNSRGGFSPDRILPGNVGQSSNVDYFAPVRAMGDVILAEQVFRVGNLLDPPSHSRKSVRRQQLCAKVQQKVRGHDAVGHDTRPGAHIRHFKHVRSSRLHNVVGSAPAKVQMENCVAKDVFGQNPQVSGMGEVSKECPVLSEAREQLGRREHECDVASFPEGKGCVEM